MSLTYYMKTPSKKLHQTGLYFGRHSRNIMFSGKFVQRTLAVTDLLSIPPLSGSRAFGLA